MRRPTVCEGCGDLAREVSTIDGQLSACCGDPCVDLDATIERVEAIEREAVSYRLLNPKSTRGAASQLPLAEVRSLELAALTLLFDEVVLIAKAALYAGPEDEDEPEEVDTEIYTEPGRVA